MKKTQYLWRRVNKKKVRYAYVLCLKFLMKNLLVLRGFQQVVSLLPVFLHISLLPSSSVIPMVWILTHLRLFHESLKLSSVFLDTFLFFLLWLGEFLCPVFEYIGFFFASSILLLLYSTVFFNSVILFFSSVASIWNF